jgi:hypothetical protein
MTQSLTQAAAEVLDRCEISPEGQALHSADDSTDGLIGKLAEAGLWPDALRLMAYALPRPHAIHWAWACSNVYAETCGPAQTAALATALAWLRKPEEEQRLPAHAASEAAGLDSAAGCVALAVFWSGGSMAPPDSPAVPPPEHLCQHVVACAVQLAGRAYPERASQSYSQFLNLGREIAAGKPIG